MIEITNHMAVTFYPGFSLTIIIVVVVAGEYCKVTGLLLWKGKGLSGNKQSLAGEFCVVAMQRIIRSPVPYECPVYLEIMIVKSIDKTILLCWTFSWTDFWCWQISGVDGWAWEGESC